MSRACLNITKTIASAIGNQNRGSENITYLEINKCIQGEKNSPPKFWSNLEMFSGSKGHKGRTTGYRLSIFLLCNALKYSLKAFAFI
jgi:hypothetical protein